MPDNKESNHDIIARGKIISLTEQLMETLYENNTITYPVTSFKNVLENLGCRIIHKRNTCAYERTGKNKATVYLDMLTDETGVNERCALALSLLIYPGAFLINDNAFNSIPLKRLQTLDMTAEINLTIMRALLMPGMLFSKACTEYSKYNKETDTYQIDGEAIAKQFNVTPATAQGRYEDINALAEAIRQNAIEDDEEHKS